jgi:hypothetical protein
VGHDRTLAANQDTGNSAGILSSARLRERSDHDGRNGIIATVSIITAVLPANAEYLDQTWRSVLAQQLPAGWSWQWLIQVDGPGPLPDSIPADDPRISLRRNARVLGPALSRTLCIARVRGELVKVLDADDTLPAGELARDVAVLTEHADIAWTTSCAIDLLPDGSTERCADDPEPGRLVRGMVVDHWRSHAHRAVVHPATLCVRADQLRAVGGWMALPASEDLGLLLTLNLLYDGYFLAEPGLIYRKWPNQLTAQARYLSSQAQTARFAVIDDRLRAIDRLRAEHAALIGSRTGPAADRLDRPEPPPGPPHSVHRPRPTATV